MKKPLNLPKFNNEDEERDFWDKIDISEYFEPSDFKLGRPHRCFAISLFLDLRCQSRFFDVWWPRIFNDKGLRWSGPLRPIEMFISY
jgi:hypothetical protein